MTPDGRYVLMSSAATGWVSGIVDSNGGPDVYLWDRDTGEHTLVSHTVGDPATAANDESFPGSISDDGRFVTFSSYGSDLVDGATDINFVADVFLWDGATGSIQLVSHMGVAVAMTANERSTPNAMSADGRYVVFQSVADDLVAGGVDDNQTWDVFVWDRDTSEVVLVSHDAVDPASAADGLSEPAAMSTDGRYIAFTSSATNLVAGTTDANAVEDAFVWDRVAGASTLVSHAAPSATTAANNFSVARAISADGRYVAYDSNATNLITGWSGSAANVFLWDRDTGGATLVSHRATGLAAGAGGSELGALSPDGQSVAFVSKAETLIAGGSDANAEDDTFHWRADSGAVALVSHTASSTTTAGDRAALPVAISADGQFVLYRSASSDHIAGGSDANGVEDAFFWDRDSGAIELVSRTPASATTPGGAASTPRAMSADGLWVALASKASDLLSGGVDGNGAQDAFLWDRTSGAHSLISSATVAEVTGANGLVSPLALSSDGRFVLFSSEATNLLAGGTATSDLWDLLQWDRTTEALTLVAHVAGERPTATNEAGSMSSDGRYVAFYSFAADLIAGGSDANGEADAFLWDQTSGLRILISGAAGSGTVAANGRSIPAAMSLDGRYVTFWSLSTDLDAGLTDLNDARDVFQWDRDTGVVTLISHVGGQPQVAADSESVPTATSADGRYVAFYSQAMSLVDVANDLNGTVEDAFLWDRITGAVTLVSHIPGAPTTTGNGKSIPLGVSADGEFVAFASKSSDLIVGNDDGNGQFDLFLWARSSGAVTLISHSTIASTSTGDEFSAFKALSADGNFVAFVSAATDLIVGGIDSNGPGADAYLWSRLTGEVQLIAHAPGDPAATANGASEPVSLSADGRYVVFSSSASDLVAGALDTNELADVYLWDRLSDSSILASHTLDDATVSAFGPSTARAMSANGSYVLFSSAARDLAPANTSAIQVYLWSANTLDATPPLNPAIDSTLPPVSIWSNSPWVEISWSGASDELGGSGMHGYSTLWDTSADTVPDAVVDEPHATDPNSVTSPPLTDGDSHYFHLSTCDSAGNCAATVHAGPFWVDTTPPAAATALASSSHAVGVPSNDPTVDVQWQAALDQAGLSGIDGYAVEFEANSGWTCDEVLDLEEGTLSTTSPVLADGEWYFHLCARDNAGNWGPVASLGPFVIETLPPGAASGLASSSHAVGVLSNDPTVDVSWQAAPDLEVPSGIDGYAIQFDGNSSWTCDEVKDVEEDTLAATSPALADGDRYFHLCARDNAGNWGPVASLGPFVIDASPPGAASALASSSHSVGVPSNDPTVDVSWQAAPDQAGPSGIDGYALQFDANSSWTCDEVLDVEEGTLATTSPVLADGDGYFHLCARDNAGNWGPVASLGPFLIDASPPGAASGLASSSHVVGVPSNDPTVDVQWQAAPDQAESSGIDGYALQFDANSGWACDEVQDVEEVTLAATSPALADGDWYFHLCARDNAGNWGPVASIGPFVIEISATVFIDGFELGDMSRWSSNVP